MADVAKIVKPADFSFMDFKYLRDAKLDTVYTTRIGSPSIGEHNKFLTRAIWLNNNNITTLAFLDVFVASVLEEPYNLTWLDLSFNNIKSIDSSILTFENLSILYLHGNMISNIKEVMKLRPIKSLKTLTVHGNPIYEKPGYRLYLIARLPQIMNLDFARVSRAETIDATALNFSIASRASRRSQKPQKFDEKDQKKKKK